MRCRATREWLPLWSCCKQHSDIYFDRDRTVKQISNLPEACFEREQRLCSSPDLRALQSHSCSAPSILPVIQQMGAYSESSQTRALVSVQHAMAAVNDRATQMTR